MIKDMKKAGMLILSLTYLIDHFIVNSDFIMGFGITLSVTLLLCHAFDVRKQKKKLFHT